MKKIYAVTSKVGIATHTRLVRAENAVRALRFAVSADYTVKLASQDELVKTLGTGIVVEETTVQTPPEFLGVPDPKQPQSSSVE